MLLTIKKKITIIWVCFKIFSIKFFTALRSTNGEFILNGNYQVSIFKHQISIVDTLLEYSGSETVEERINATGPIKADIYLQLLSVGQLYPPNIHYQYMISTATKNNLHSQVAANNYYWRNSENWSDCSAKCQGKMFIYILI